MLYVAGHFMAPPYTSGSARPLELARRFVADGHDVTLLSTDAHLRHAGLTLEDIPDEHLGGVHVELTRSHYDNTMGFARRKVEFANQATKQAGLALRGTHDLVYATSTPLSVLGPALARRRLRSTPFVFEVRDVWPQAPIELGALQSSWQRRAAHALADLGYREAVHVVTLSEGMRDMIVARGVPQAHITVAHNAATARPASSATTAGDALPTSRPDELATWLGGAHRSAIYAGTIGLANDVAWLLDLVAAVDETLDLRIAIVGDGAMAGAIARRLATAGDHVRSRVRMFGPRPKGDLAPAMATVDFALSTFADHPSLTSNSPNKVFDAWAHGVPVVINNGGWLAAELDGHGAGLALPRNPRQAAGRLAAWLRDDAALADARAAARRRNREVYNWDVTHARVRDGVTAALQRRTPRGDS